MSTAQLERPRGASSLAKPQRNEEIRALAAQGTPRSELAETYGISRQRIDEIVGRPALTDRTEGMDVSALLADLRDVLRPSLSAMGDDTGVHPSSLKQLSAGTRLATPHTRRKIVEALRKRRERLSEIIFALEVDE